MNNLKVVVAHPGKQHSFQVATALEREGMLFKYITTVYDKPGSLTNCMKSLLRGKDLNKAGHRRCEYIPDEKVLQFCEFSGLILLLLMRIPHLFGFNHDFWWCYYLNAKFSKKVAKYIEKHNIDAVIMFDTTADNCFRILKKKNLKATKIMDESIATRMFMKNTFSRDYGVKELKKEYPEFWMSNIMRSYEEETYNSDYFVVASEVVKKSLLYSDICEEKISIVPYGVNYKEFVKCKDKSFDPSKPLTLIYVGQISYRKGLHHLLNVVRKYDKTQLRVILAGDYKKNTPIYTKYKDLDNVEFLGFVTRDKLAEEYSNADAFIFPTIGEGYGLVVLEALYCGVPVFSSDLAGGNDAIVDGYNGFVFEGGNDDAIKQQIEWMMNNRKELFNMRKNAVESSKNFSWEAYYSRYAQIIREFLKR